MQIVGWHKSIVAVAVWCLTTIITSHAMLNLHSIKKLLMWEVSSHHMQLPTLKYFISRKKGMSTWQHPTPQSFRPSNLLSHLFLSIVLYVVICDEIKQREKEEYYNAKWLCLSMWLPERKLLQTTRLSLKHIY